MDIFEITPEELYTFQVLDIEAEEANLRKLSYHPSKLLNDYDLLFKDLISHKDNLIYEERCVLLALKILKHPDTQKDAKNYMKARQVIDELVETL